MDEHVRSPSLHYEADSTTEPFEHEVATTSDDELPEFFKDMPEEGDLIEGLTQEEIIDVDSVDEQEGYGSEFIDSQIDEIGKQLITLQKQNSLLRRKEQELLSSMHMNQLLQEEIERLQEANELLESRLLKFTKMEKTPFLIEVVENLEAELAEAEESTSMYKAQLKSISERERQFSLIDLEDLGKLDQLREELSQYKNKVAKLEEELQDVTKLHFNVSLELAEAEEARCQISMTIHQLKRMNCTMLLPKDT